MKIFFAGSIRSGRQLVPTYKYMLNFLKSQNHTIMSEHAAMQSLEKAEAGMTEQEIYEKDMSWIDDSDCVVAEVTIPSTGVGYEICHAVSRKKPVLCVYEEGASVSAMVLGNTSRYVTSIPYSHKQQLERILLDFLEKIKNA